MPPLQVYEALHVWDCTGLYGYHIPWGLWKTHGIYPAGCHMNPQPLRYVLLYSVEGQTDEGVKRNVRHTPSMASVPVVNLDYFTVHGVFENEPNWAAVMDRIIRVWSQHYGDRRLRYPDFDARYNPGRPGEGVHIG